MLSWGPMTVQRGYQFAHPGMRSSASVEGLLLALITSTGWLTALVFFTVSSRGVVG
jgi:hypothetical protein